MVYGENYRHKMEYLRFWCAFMTVHAWLKRDPERTKDRHGIVVMCCPKNWGKLYNFVIIREKKFGQQSQALNGNFKIFSKI